MAATSAMEKSEQSRRTEQGHDGQGGDRGRQGSWTQAGSLGKGFPGRGNNRGRNPEGECSQARMSPVGLEQNE